MLGGIDPRKVCVVKKKARIIDAYSPTAIVPKSTRRKEPLPNDAESDANVRLPVGPAPTMHEPCLDIGHCCFLSPRYKPKPHLCLSFDWVGQSVDKEPSILCEFDATDDALSPN